MAWLWKILTVLPLVILLPLLIDALSVQVQYQLFGEMRFSNSPLYPALVLIVLVVILFKRRLRVDVGMTWAALALSTYLLAIFGAQSASASLPFNYLVNGYNASFLLVLLLLAAFFAPAFITQKTSVRFLIGVALVTSALGILQYLLEDPILPTEIGLFKVSAWRYLDTMPPRVRGFSLFSSALNFGFFLIFMLGMALYLCRSSRWGIALLAIILMACFCTLTRNIYLSAPFAMIGALLYTRGTRRPTLLWLTPLLALAAALTVSGVETGGTGLTDSRTLGLRASYWRDEVQRQLVAGEADIFFGQGLYQDAGEGSGRLFVDNTYLQMIAQVGLFGLVLYLWLYAALLRWTITQRPSAMSCALYGFLVAWPFLAMFNIAVAEFARFAIPVVMTMPGAFGRTRASAGLSRMLS